MNELPMLFPVSPTEFWNQMKMMMEETIDKKLSQQPQSSNDVLPGKALLKVKEVCALFEVSTPTVYEWLKQGKLKSFKIKSRRYFRREDMEAIIQAHNKLK